MTTILPVVKPISQIHLAPGSQVTIPNVTWSEFESLLQEMGQKRLARISYSHRKWGVGNRKEIKPLLETDRSLVGNVGIYSGKYC